jgi:DNA-binding transcriptional ArsR family regulator
MEAKKEACHVRAAANVSPSFNDIICSDNRFVVGYRCICCQKLEVTQPTASEHLRILSDAGLLKSKKIKQWIFYKRDADGIRRARRSLTEVL